MSSPQEFQPCNHVTKKQITNPAIDVHEHVYKDEDKPQSWKFINKIWNVLFWVSLVAQL